MHRATWSLPWASLSVYSAERMWRRRVWWSIALMWQAIKEKMTNIHQFMVLIWQLINKLGIITFENMLKCQLPQFWWMSPSMKHELILKSKLLPDWKPHGRTLPPSSIYWQPCFLVGYLSNNPTCYINPIHFK